MKSSIFSAVIISLVFTCQSCDKYLGVGSLGGTLSPMGEVGTTFSSSGMEIAGVSGFEATVVSVKDDISSFSGSAIVTNAALKSVLANCPQLTINGNKVTGKDVKFKITSEGIESVAGLEPGIIVKFDAKVGDSYKTDSNTDRTVKSVSTADEYPYGFMLIKVIKIEESINPLSLKSSAPGLKKINYSVNHKFGLVGIEFVFDDGSTANFPVYASTNN